MRHGVTGTRTDNVPVAVVGLGMAFISTLVALSGLTLPLPEVVYRIAVELGTVVDAADPFDGGSDLRTTPLTGDVVLTPAERAALRAERRRAAARGPVQLGVTTTRRPARHVRRRSQPGRQSLRRAPARPHTPRRGTPPRQPSGRAPPRAFVHPMRTPQRRSPRPAARRSTRPAARRSTRRGRDEARDQRRDGEE